MRFFKNIKNLALFTMIIGMLFFIGCASAPPPESEPAPAPVSDPAPAPVPEPENVTLQLQESFVFSGHNRGAQGLSFSPTETQLASGGWDNHIFIWDYNIGTQLVKIADAHKSDVVALKYDNTGSFFVSAGLDKTIRFWDTKTGKSLGKIRWI